MNKLLSKLISYSLKPKWKNGVRIIPLSHKILTSIIKIKGM